MYPSVTAVRKTMLKAQRAWRALKKQSRADPSPVHAVDLIAAGDALVLATARYWQARLDEALERS